MAGEWIAQLPADLQGNESLTGYATLGDFAKSHLEATGKLTEAEGKLTTLEGEFSTYKERSIPRLPENATDEDKNLFYTALGRPEKADQYEFEGEDKNAPEWTKEWKETFHRLNVPKDMAKEISKEWNTRLQNLVEAHNANIQKGIQESSEKLKAELGDKYDSSVELAKRMWQKHSDGDFDKSFAAETSANRYSMIRFLLNIAKLTGEDSSPAGMPGSRSAGGGGSGEWFPNSPPSPSGK